jgi:hypothetical protein
LTGVRKTFFSPGPELVISVCDWMQGMKRCVVSYKVRWYNRLWTFHSRNVPGNKCEIYNVDHNGIQGVPGGRDKTSGGCSLC